MKNILGGALENEINILICDNCEDQEIENLYKQIKLKYRNIYYKRNTKEKVFDINCFNALDIPQTRYVWAIGDGLIVDSSKLKKILTYLEEDYDFVVFDFMNRLQKEKIKGIHTDEIEFFKDVGWHVTLLGSTILKKDLINETLKYNSQKYIGTYFMHLGILLESISNKKFKGIVKKEEVCYQNILKKESTWSSLTFDTFCDGWINFINLLPEVYNFEKEYVIKTHGIKSGLFSIKNLILIRLNYREYYLKDIYRNRQNIERVTDVSLILIYLTWLSPKFLLSGIRKISKILKRR